MKTKSKGVIAVDVDITVCAIDELWFKWLNNVCYPQDKLSNSIDSFIWLCGYGGVDYNLSNYYKSYLEYYNIDGLDFFRGTNIYDLATQVEGAYDNLKKLSEHFDIVFVSVCKGNHHRNKYYWLKRNFPFMKGFLATHEKHLVRCDYLIDDRNKYLNMMPDDVECIKLKTPYTQCEEEKRDIITCENWDSIYEHIKGEIE